MSSGVCDVRYGLCPVLAGSDRLRIIRITVDEVECNSKGFFFNSLICICSVCFTERIHSKVDSVSGVIGQFRKLIGAVVQ